MSSKGDYSTLLARADEVIEQAIRQAEVRAAKTMIERTADRFGLKPERLAADSAYGSAPSLHWLVETKGIAPHVTSPGAMTGHSPDPIFSSTRPATSIPAPQASG